MTARGVILAALAVAVVAGFPFAGESVAAESGSQSDSMLSQCVQREGKLNIVVLMDESGSLKGSDPENVRVDGLKSLVVALADDTRGADGKQADVRLLFAGFAGTVTPDPKSVNLRWIDLDDASLDSALNEIDEYRAKNNRTDTDYATALAAASSYFDRGASADGRPCRAIIFFTDGKFNIGDRAVGGKLPVTVPWDKSLDLTKPGGGARAVLAGKQFLCRRGGLIDRMRVGPDGVQIYSIGLTGNPDNPELDFLRSISSGSGDCGRESSSSVGEYQTANAGELFFRFRDVVTGNSGEISSGDGQFVMARGIERVTLRAVTTSPGTKIELTSPSGKATEIVADTKRRKLTVDGLALSVLWPSSTTVELRGKNEQSESSTGLWKFEFTGTDDAKDSRYTLEFSPDISIQVVDEPSILRGEVTTLQLVARDASGEPIKWFPTFADTTVEGVVVDPESGREFPLELEEPDPDGNITGTVTVDSDVSAPFVNLNLAMAFQIPQSKLSATTSSSYKLKTALPPGRGYPYPEPPKITAPELVGAGTTSGSTELLGSRSHNGCVWLESAQSDVSDGVARAVLLDGKPMPDSAEECAKVLAGERHKLEVSFSTAENDDQLARGWVKLGVTSDVDPKPETITVDASARFVHEVDVPGTIGLTILFTLIGLAIPLGMLCLLNWFGAQLAPPALIRYWTGRVSVDPETGEVRDGDGNEIAVTMADMSYVNRSLSDPVRSFDLSPFSVRSVAVGRRGGSIWQGLLTIISGPYAEAAAGTRRVLGGAEGAVTTWPDGSAQELPLSLSGSWLFTPDRQIRNENFDSVERVNEPAVEGNLTIFVGGDQAGSLVDRTVSRACTGLIDIPPLSSGETSADVEEGDGEPTGRIPRLITSVRDRFSRKEKKRDVEPEAEEEIDLGDVGL